MTLGVTQLGASELPVIVSFKKRFIVPSWNFGNSIVTVLVISCVIVLVVSTVVILLGDDDVVTAVVFLMFWVFFFLFLSLDDIVLAYMILSFHFIFRQRKYRYYSIKKDMEEYLRELSCSAVSSL